MLRAVVLTQYRRVTDRQTDGQTDGIAVDSTALAMRALRRAVKIHMTACAMSNLTFTCYIYMEVDVYVNFWVK